MFNLNKTDNFGTVLRSAAAFGVHEVFLIEEDAKLDNKKSKSKYGDRGTFNKMKMRVFPTIDDIRVYCTEKNIKICGIEILPQAQSISDHPFTGDTLFMLGNESYGLTQD